MRRENRAAYQRAYRERRGAEYAELEAALQRAYREKPGVRERMAAYQRAYRERPEVKERRRAQTRAYRERYPTVGLAGERVRLDRVPGELRPVVDLIVETRRELQRRHQP